MRYVVVSLDYEIFGNGTGDVRHHIIDPTGRMARIAEKYELPITIFVDMEEVLAFQRHATELQIQCGYDPYSLIRRQIEDLSRRGHDVQLHLHPQWHRASLKAGRWQLDEAKATVDSLFETVEETAQYVASRKSALEEMANARSTGRHVTVYRAGAFSAQPGKKLIQALVENEFKVDSSVVHGLHYQDENVSLDYRAAPRGRSMWRVQTDVAAEDAGGALWEVPITAKQGRRINQFTFGRLKAKFSKNVPREQQSRMIKQLGVRNPFQALQFLFRPIPLKFDFHNVAPRKLHDWIRKAPAAPKGTLDPVVLIGHTKEHIDDAGFETLLRSLKNDSTLRVASFSEIANKLPMLSGSPGAPRVPLGSSPGVAVSASTGEVPPPRLGEGVRSTDDVRPADLRSAPG